MTVEETRQKLIRLAFMVHRDEGLRTTLSTSEHLAVALLLNRADWLDEMQITLLGAIDRVGSKTLDQLRRIERETERAREGLTRSG